MTQKKKNIPKPTNFGSNLKFLRRMHGMTQGDFAKVIGITRNSIASYENGVVEPNALNFLKVSVFFNIDARELLEDNVAEKDNQENQSNDNLQQYMVDSFTEFLSQTNEMTKVFEGYKTFYDMQKDRFSDPDNKDFYLILDDLMNLLKSLIKENWKLIQHMHPHYVKDEDISI